MGKPYSLDLRNRVVAAIEGGMSRNQAAKRFGIAISTAIGWMQRVEETGSVEPGQMGGHKPKAISADHAVWLSRRLKDLEAAGVVIRRASRTEPGVFEYELTEAGQDLKPVVMAFGIWGQRWVEAEPSLDNLDVSLLMWDMRRNLVTTPMPKRRSVVQFRYPALSPARRSYWLIVEPDEPVDLCSVDPGFDVDLYVEASLEALTEVYLGRTSLRSALTARRIRLTGRREACDAFPRWFGSSPFAPA